MSKKLRFSVNPNLIDKNPPPNKLSMSHGFKPIEDTIEALADIISTEGWAFSFQFSIEHRAIHNFLATDILSVDIDGGTTIDKTLKNPLVEQFCSLIYTTVSHTADNHRFRMVFALPRTLTSPLEVSYASRALTRRLGGDPAATDAARMSYGSRGCSPMLLGNSLSDEFLDELIKDGKVAPARDSIAPNHSTANRSELKINPDLMVQTSTGSVVRLDEIIQKTAICCPFHHDESPSAFVNINKKGDTYLRCMTCQMTWWMKGGSPSGYDFYGFEEAIRSVRDKKISKKDPSPNPFDGFTDLSLLPPKHIEYTQTKHLCLGKLPDGLSFIKSPKGSGKTTSLAQAVQQTIFPYATLSFEEFEDATFDNENPTIFGSETVLLIGHRQALIGELCQRLRLNCYLDDPKGRYGEAQERQKRYGLCLDSLHKVRGKKYDIILIDEVEQVLGHFMSETVGEQRIGLFRLFTDLMRQAEKVVVLDADLGWVTFTTLTLLTQKVSLLNNKSKPSGKTKSLPIHIFINDYKTSGQSLNLYPSEPQMVQRMIEDILAGKRVFVTSNSKEKIKTLEKSIEKAAKECEVKLSTLTITSENSRQKEIQEFIKDIKKKILDYDVVLSSPSLGTGIDITFENDAQEIDCVYGFFENLINTHFEIDQQLARVRNPKEINVWVSPAKYCFETEFGVVSADYLYDLFIDVVHDDSIDPTNLLGTAGIDPFYVLASMIITHQRASKNNLKSNFIENRERQGWRVIPVSRDEEEIKKGKSKFAEGKILKNAQYVENVVSAKVMNQLEYLQFEQRVDSNDGNIEADEWYSFYKTRIELFYGVSCNESLVKSDDRGKLMAQVRQLERLIAQSDFMKGGSEKAPISHNDKIHRKLFKNKVVGCQLLYGLLSLTPIFEGGQFKPEVIFTKDNLVKFAKASLKFKKQTEIHLEVTTRGDVVEKPTQHLSQLLSLLGLKIVQPQKPKVSDGKKTYFYQLESKSLDHAHEILSRRQNLMGIGWNFVNNLHKFKYSADQMDEIIDLMGI
jgi:Origin of replication binding protein